jgi:oligopeptide/dipeptide ABC transporter ATP-binding protein
MTTPVLEARDLVKTYRAWRFFGRGAAEVHAVDSVSFAVFPGESLAIVGESGCGKTTTAKMLLRLEMPTAGEVRFRGIDLAQASSLQLRQYRAAVQAVFQDPWSSLNPRMRVSRIVAEPLRLNARLAEPELESRVAEALVAVGLGADALRRFPHEFSGGQRQRIAIARALSLRPDAIVLDEPVSALDVSIGAQIMNLLKDLQQQTGVAYVLIAHNLATVRYLADRVVVMYLGRLVEEGTSEALFRQPGHPYTQALIESARLKRGRWAIAKSGPAPDPAASPRGCGFAPRCPQAMDRCRREAPSLAAIERDHRVACFLY